MRTIRDLIIILASKVVNERKLTIKPEAKTRSTQSPKFLDRVGLGGFPWLQAIALYTISFGWLYTVRGSYWSADWENFVFPELTTFDFDTLGFAPWLKANLILYEVLGPSFMRLLIFLCFFSAGIFLYGISQKFDFLSLAERRILTLLFLILPFNTARVALMVFHYSEAYFFFFCGWYLLVTFRSLAIKYFCLILFFLSFQMHSMLFFYLLPIAHLFFLSKTKNLLGHFRWLVKNAVFLILPFFYWTLRTLFWPEQVAYHNVTTGVIGSSLNALAIAFAIGAGLYYLWRRVDLKYRPSVLVILTGFIVLFVGIYPYILYGFFGANRSLPILYVTTFLGRTSWYTRHQILQPLGISLVIIGLVKYFEVMVGRAFQRWHRLVLFVCVIFNVGFGFEHVVDYSKQKEITSQLKIAGESESKNYYQFLDQTRGINARGQTMYYRAWSGLIGLAYGSDEAGRIKIETNCIKREDARLVLIAGPDTHWQAFKNWMSDGDMGFKVLVDDTPKACEPEMVKSEKVSGMIPILFYFTGVD